MKLTGTNPPPAPPPLRAAARGVGKTERPPAPCRVACGTMGTKQQGEGNETMVGGARNDGGEGKPNNRGGTRNEKEAQGTS